MLAGLFNVDIYRRLADLQKALTEGRAIGARFLEGYEHAQSRQPDRIVVEILETPRKLVFGIEMDRQVADQLEANKRVGAAQTIRDVLPA